MKKTGLILASAFALLFCATQQSQATYKSGSNGGYYWALWWNDVGSASISFPSGGGNYKCTWSNIGDVIGGKGWNPGSTRSVGYNCGYISGYAAFGLYWWKSPQSYSDAHECYITDMGTRSGTYKGTVNSDGGTYNIYLANSGRQFNSSRTSKQSTGANHTITMSNHINAWKSKGMNMGSTWDALRLAAEAWGNSSGSVNATVW